MSSLPTYAIVVPAHNEERYIGATLRKLARLDHRAYEVIVVENGSADDTYHVAKQYSTKKLKVYSLKKGGVSLAKNFGATKVSRSVKWIIFLDADTWLEKSFLRELDAFLQYDLFAIGTTRVKPIEKSQYMTFWFRFYDYVHRFFHASCSIQIARRDIFKKVRYDERLALEEDFQLIKDMERYGRFFYFDTKTVSASTRRFTREGPLKLTLQWLIAAIIPHSWRSKMTYRTIR